MKIVYHAKYLEYFEQARTDLFRSLGLVYSEIEKAGIFLVVLEVQVNYHRPAQYDDIVHVKAVMKELPKMKITINYEITRNSENDILVTGETIHVFLDAHTNRPIRPPKEYIELMQKQFP